MLKTDQLVLLLEDNVELALLYQTLLEQEGYSVAVGKDGSEGLEFLKQGLRPKLILLDALMPHMNGDEFLEHAMEENLLDRDTVDIVAFSSLDSSADLLKRLSKHVNSCVEKPSDVKSFLALISAHMPASHDSTV